MNSVSEREELVVSNGIRHALHRFEAAGEIPSLGGRKTVLLLHGFLDAGRTWELVAAPLARAGYEVIAPDFRGFGASGRVPPGGYYHFADYVADLDGIVDALAPEWLAIVSHSMGGGVGTLYTGTRPERVQRLVVMEGIGPASDLPELGVDRMRAWLRDLGRVDRTPRSVASKDEALTRLAATHARIDKAILETRIERLLVEDAEGRLVWAWDPLHRTTSPIPFNPQVYMSFLRAITCPTLFIGGGPHGWHPPDEEERLACIANLKRIDFPEAGHMMHWTAPETVAEAIRAFLRE